MRSSIPCVLLAVVSLGGCPKRAAQDSGSSSSGGNTVLDGSVAASDGSVSLDGSMAAADGSVPPSDGGPGPDASLPPADAGHPVFHAAHDLVPAARRVTGGTLVMDVQAGFPVPQRKATGGTLTLEGNATIKP